MDATPSHARDGRLEPADDLFEQAVASAPLARDPARAQPPEERRDSAELTLALRRARAHVARRRAELPPLPA